MESINNIIKDNLDIKDEKCLNGGIINKFEDFNFNTLNKIETKNTYKINIIPKTKRKVNEIKLNKKLTENSSFLAFRKYSNGNTVKEDKNYINSIVLNENHINMASLSNISNSNLLEKNENIFRNTTKKDKIKDMNNSTTTNKINSIFDNKFEINLKINKDKYLSQKNHNQILNNNVKLNNFINKSKTINYLENSQMFRKNSSKILKRFCFICEVFEEKLYHSKNCSHLLCKECAKSYYEQQAEKGIYNIKCPKYNCNYNLNLKDIKEIVSSEIYTKIEAYTNIKKTTIDNNKSIEKNIDELIEMNSNKRNSTTMEINNNLNDSNKKIKIKKKKYKKMQIPKLINKNNNIIHFTLKQHMIKITDFTRFKSRVKNEKEIKKTVCTKCGKSTLFSRDDQNFIRCLNCGKATCKYCHKQLESSNTLRKLNALCGICYGHIRFHSNQSYIKKILFEILFVISGFFVVWIGFSKYEANFIIRNTKRNKYIFIFVLFIFLAVNFVVMILLAPYFPIIISIFE